MLFAGLTAVAMAPASAAPQVYEVHSDQVVNVPSGVNTVTMEIHGAAGGAGGQTGGSPGRGAVETIQVPVTPGQAIAVGVGQHGGNAALSATGPAGGGGTGNSGNASGGNGGKGANGAFGTYGAAGGGGGGATAVYLDGNLLAVAGGGGGGGGTNALTSPGGDGGNADADGQPGSDIPNASGGENGDAPTPKGGPGEDATGAFSGGGGAGGGGGGYEGGSGGAFTAFVAGSSGGGGGGGDSYFDSAKATQLSRTATESGNGYVTFTYAMISPTTLTFTNTPINIVNREMHGYTLHVARTEAIPTQSDPTGTIELTAESQSDGTIYNLGSKTVDSNGNVKIFSDKLKAGDYTLTGVYTPDAASAQDSQASQATLDLTVAKGDTQVVVSGPSDPVNYGDDVVLGVSVLPTDPAQGTPSGKVQFSTGSGNLDGPVTLDADGKATLTTHHLPVGTVDVTATYLGDKEFNGSSNDVAFEFVVNPGDTTVTLTEEHNPTISGENAYFDVQVTPTSAVVAKPAAGTEVDLYDNNVLIDTGYINSHGYVQFVEDWLATNDNDHHHLKAVFNPGGTGDPNFDESTSNFLDAVVNYGDVKVDVTSDVNPQKVGKDVTFTIHVTGLKPTSYPYDPTGDVQLYVNGSAFNAPITIDASGYATVTTSDLPLGAASVYAEYKGDDHYKVASSNILTENIYRASLKIRLATSGIPAYEGQNVTIHAKLSPTDDTTAKIEGVLQYYSNDKKIAGSIPVSGTNGGSIVLHHVKPGKYRIVAKFKPKTAALYNIAVSDTLIQVVRSGKPNAKINMSVKRTSSSTGVVKVHVKKTSGADVKGHVVIYVDGAPVKTIVLNSHGEGSYTLTGLPNANVLVTAAYQGRGSVKPVSAEKGLHL
jgi:hypothetical protein